MSPEKLHKSPRVSPKKGLKVWIARVAALLLGTVLALFFAELVVLFVVGEVPKFPRHVVRAPWGLRYNEPNARYRHKSADVTVEFRINGQGMRADRDYEHAKLPGSQRMVTLGDSFAIGFEVPVEATFSSVLETTLSDAGVSIEVLNCGVSGFSNAEEFLYLERELLRYSPDLVLVSFYGNDLQDNVRTGLFELEGDRLVQARKGYVPAGRLGDFLNTNWFFNLLSERSNAFVFVKERLTAILRRDMARRNRAVVDRGRTESTVQKEDVQNKAARAELRRHTRQLSAAIFEEMYQLLHSRGIPLVILSIPSHSPGSPLLDQFPLEYFDVTRDGISFLSAQPLLSPYFDKEPLYYLRSQNHWTPLSHQLSGGALAELILSEDLLEASTASGD